MDEAKLEMPRILIVDDTPKNIQVLGTILRQENYQINIASNGQQAIEMAENVQPDLILLDIMMPEMDGFQACQKLKGQEKTSHIPVIFLSAKSETEDIIKGFELGAGDYVTKPFNASELLARVRTHLQLKKAKDIISNQNRERKVLLQVICHDLTNPLVGIKGIVDLLDSLENIEDLKEFIPFLISGVDNAISVVDLVRTMQSIESEGKEWTLTSTHLKPSIEECLNTLKTQIENKDLTIDLDLSDDLCVLAESISFNKSVLPNIIGNAIKYSHKGTSVTITAEVKDQNNIVLKVSDKGIGMSEKLLEDIYNVETKTTRVGTLGEEGTGYGVVLVLKFMEIYGGSMSFESSENEKDHGTTVELLFQKDLLENVIG